MENLKLSKIAEQAMSNVKGGDNGNSLCAGCLCQGGSYFNPSNQSDDTPNLDNGE